MNALDMFRSQSPRQIAGGLAFTIFVVSSPWLSLALLKWIVM